MILYPGLPPTTRSLRCHLKIHQLHFTSIGRILATNVQLVWITSIVASMATVSAVGNSNFTFDGSSSDMAQQFYNLHSVGYQAPALSLDYVPSSITARLSNYSLEFTSLPPLLQRAVIWNSGCVTAYGNTKLSTIYTMCKNASTMADIALPLSQYEKPGCIARNCTDPLNNSTATHRSLYCTGAQMLTVSVCAASIAGDEMDASMWATGGNDALIPVPNAVTHKWTDSETGKPYLVYAIHMVGPDHEWASCPTKASDSAMVIPCVPYANVETASDWCRPSPSSLVDSWLAETPASGSASQQQLPRLLHHPPILLHWLQRSSALLRGLVQSFKASRTQPQCTTVLPPILLCSI